MPLSNLPPAVPSFDAEDLETACALIGERELYVRQLQRELARRADEANALDDALKEANARIDELTREV